MVRNPVFSALVHILGLMIFLGKRNGFFLKWKSPVIFSTDQYSEQNNRVLMRKTASWLNINSSMRLNQVIYKQHFHDIYIFTQQNNLSWLVICVSVLS